MNNNTFLSVVVVSRNDNHGGDLTRRTQIFINSLFAQADKHKISMELVFVEWNPPQDKTPVIEAFVWPPSKFCKLKIVTVPPEEHKKIPHSDGLPLFQMIGKNVGIRNASGEYILVTNIDVILSNEICKYIKSKLKKGIIYRCDRWDVAKDVPITENINETLKYCKDNIIRIQTAGETVPVNHFYKTSRFYPKLKSGLMFVRPLTRNINNNINVKLMEEILFRLKCLLFDNINKSYNRFIELKNNNLLSIGIVLKGIINWLKLLWINFFHFYGAITGGILGLIIFSVFSKSFAISAIVTFLFSTIGSSMASICGSVLGILLGSFIGSLSGVTIVKIKNFQTYLKCLRLRTNACGDFMLMDKESWFKSRGYYESPMYSWHLDSIFMFMVDALNIKCTILPSNCIIYHIEHGGGWTPETEQQLFASLDKRNVPYFKWNDLLLIDVEINKGKEKSRFYNNENWGCCNTTIQK